MPTRIVRDINVSKFCNCKKQVNNTLYNFRNDAIRWKISKCIKVVRCIFSLVLTVLEIFTFQIDDLQKVGKDHRVEFSQCFHSMTNIYQNLRSRPMKFCAISNCFRYIKVSNFLSSKRRARSPSTIFTMILFDGEYKSL